MTTSISNKNQDVHNTVKTYFNKTSVSYCKLYRNPFVENSKKNPLNNIDGCSIKYYGCRLNKKQYKELNALLETYNVKAIEYIVGNTKYFYTCSVRIVNI